MDEQTNAQQLDSHLRGSFSGVGVMRGRATNHLRVTVQQFLKILWMIGSAITLGDRVKQKCCVAGHVHTNGPPDRRAAWDRAVTCDRHCTRAEGAFTSTLGSMSSFKFTATAPEVHQPSSTILNVGGSPASLAAQDPCMVLREHVQYWSPALEEKKSTRFASRTVWLFILACRLRASWWRNEATVPHPWQ